MSTGRRPPYVPFTPLEDYLRYVDADMQSHNGRKDNHHVMVGAIATRIGRSAQTVHRWRTNGCLSMWQADAIAIHLDSHPALIWPDFHKETP